jgi:hypothetical protein
MVEEISNCSRFRILKDSCGGKVFPSRSDFKHCRQMFNTQKEIMRRVGFTDEVNLFRSANKNLLTYLGYKYGLYNSIGNSSFNKYSFFT